MSRSIAIDDFEFKAEFDDLDITSEAVDFDEVGDDLEKFQQDEILRKVLSEGVDLRQYAKQIELDLQTAEEDTIQQFLDEAEELVALHHNIQNCDATLEHMQQIMTGFQLSLGGLSAEIKNLQSETLSLNVKLANRTELEGTLMQFTDSLNVTNDVVNGINSPNLDANFITQLGVLGQKLAFLSTYKNFTAVQESTDGIERLKMKAASKISGYLGSRFIVLTKPRAELNHKQQQLLPLKPCYEFVATHVPSVGSEIRSLYVNNIGEEYFLQMQAYLQTLRKLLADGVGDSSEMIGVEEVKDKGFFALGKRSVEDINRNFLLGMRDLVVVQQIEQDPVLAATASDRGVKLPFETIFRHASRLLLDMAIPESNFLVGFFDSREMLLKVMKKASDLVKDAVETWVKQSNDLVGILILLRVIDGHRYIAKQKGSPGCLDGFFDRLQQLIWPVLLDLLEQHAKSISQANTTLDKSVPLGPHYVTIRIAWFLTAVRALSRPLPNGQTPFHVEQQLISKLVVLRGAFEEHLAAVVKKITVPKKQAIFLIQNYELVLSCLQERDIGAADDIAYFTQAQDRYLNAFVDEELNEKFGRLLSFVKQTEVTNKAIESGSEEQRLDPAVVESIVKGFAAAWKDSIEKISASVVSAFGAGSQGAMNAHAQQHTVAVVLRRCLGQFITYFERFDALVNAHYRSPAILGALVPVHAVRFQVKKYDLVQAPQQQAQ